MTYINPLLQTNFEDFKKQTSQKGSQFYSTQQIQAVDTFEKDKKGQEEPNKTNRAKAFITSLIALVAGAVVAGICIANNKKTPTRKIEDLIPTKKLEELGKDGFKKIQSEKFTGKVEGTLSNGDELVMEYVDGILKKSTKTGASGILENVYDGGIITKSVDGKVVKTIDTLKIRADVCQDQEKLEEILNDNSLASFEIKQKVDEIKYKSKQDEEKIKQLVDSKIAEEKKAAHIAAKPVKYNLKFIEEQNLDKFLASISYEDLAKYGKKGLPLKYPLKQMEMDLYDYLSTLQPEVAAVIKKDFNIVFSGGFLKYRLSDIPNLNVLPTSIEHKKVFDILQKFAKQNDLLVPNLIKLEFEELIDNVPEFMFMIGKQQNSVHSYSLDIHTLMNLKKALELAKGANLSDEQQQILKMSVLLHDIGKKFIDESISDTGHAAQSAKYAKQILDNYKCPKAIKNKIYNLIQNHHWFKEYNKSNISAQDVADMFGDELEIAKIMAQADIESVNSTFHLGILQPSKLLSEEQYQKILSQKMDAIVSNDLSDALASSLPTGLMPKYTEYELPIGNKNVSIQMGQLQHKIPLNDPELVKYCKALKEGESFGIGCIGAKQKYPDVKIEIGDYYADKVSNHHLVIKKQGGKLYIESHSNNGTTIIKNIPTKANTNPKIASFIDSLKKKAGVTSVSKTYVLTDGSSAEFEVLLNSKTGGSNVGYYVINKRTGDLFYAKEAQGGDQLKAEYLATKLYEAAGVNVPKVSLFKCSDGTNGILSKFVPELSPVYKASAEASEGFGMDVLLANWDVVGLTNDNLLTNGQKIIRIDAGGSFDYHAHQGANKPYGFIPTELITMLNPNINKQTAGIFGKMTREDMIASLERVVNLSKEDINKSLKEASCKKYKDKIFARQAFIADVVAEMKKTPQDSSEDMLVYMKKIMQISLENYVSNAKSYDELENVKYVIKFFGDEQMNKQLQGAIVKQESKLSKILPKVIKLTTQDTTIMLEQAGFAKNSQGRYVKKLMQYEKDKIAAQYGGTYATYVAQKIEKPLSSSDIQNITTMLNTCNGKYIHLAKKDMDSFVELYQNIYSNGKTGIFPVDPKVMTDDKWAVIFNILQNEKITAGQLEAFSDYKGYSDIINGALSAIKKGKKKFSDLAVDTQEQINNIQSYINTQVFPEAVTLYRGEGYEVLESVKLPNGKSLSQMLQTIDTNNPVEMEKLRYAIIKDNYVATQERFMSTSLLPGHEFDHKPILWELEAQKGSKGVMLEGINVNAGLQSECEVLLQKDSKILITDIEYKGGHWHLKGEVIN